MLQPEGATQPGKQGVEREERDKCAHWRDIRCYLFAIHHCTLLLMNGSSLQKRESGGDNPDELSQLLEIELIQKRAEWQRATARNKNFKSASILFLTVVILAGLVVFYIAFTRSHESRPPATELTAPVPP